MDIPSAEISSEERLLAGLSHLLGWLFALIIYLVERGKSRFVSFQALQALLFSAMMLIVNSLVVGCLLTLVFGGMGVGVLSEAMAVNSVSEPGAGLMFAAASMLGFWLAMPVFLVVALLSMVLRLIAAVISFTGHTFRYPVLGPLADRISG